VGRSDLSTPVRRQYLEIKAQHPDAVLFFRLGDFYETFDDDAELVAGELDIALTSKPMGKGLRVPLAGVPVQSVDGYLAKLIERGHRVAICEQLEDPKATKGLVQRGVVRVVSPGTALDPALLEQGSSNYCAALVVLDAKRGGVLDGKRDGRRAGIAAVDLSTGDFRVCELSDADGGEGLEARAARELARLGVAELLLPEGGAPNGVIEDALESALQAERLSLKRTAQAAQRFEPAGAAQRLSRHYGLSDVEGLGLAERPAGLAAAGALLEYLVRSQPGLFREGAGESGVAGMPHLGRPTLYEAGATMQLDGSTERALALFPTGAAGEDREATLLGQLDRCATAAGRRLLAERLARPLLDLEALEERLDRVEALAGASLVRRRVGETLKQVPDMERLLGRISTGLALPGEVARLGVGLEAAAELRSRLGEREDLATSSSAVLGRIAEELRPCRAASEAIGATLVGEPLDSFEEGGVVRPGFDAELDRWRAQLRAGRAALAALEGREREATGINNLKVGYHRTFGYYLEVTKGQMDRVPDDWQRRQTLAGGERYVTEELRQEERRLLAARDGLAVRERALFEQLCRQVAAEAEPVRALAQAVARLDVAWAGAELAVERNYVRPQLDRSQRLSIREGRHPVVERALTSGRFVPNDCDLDAGSAQLLLITGPNMAGKSTYLRQTALIVLMAQIGSFVPAAEARIGLVDRVFARVGARDDLAAGQSTFMVEMLESAAILATASDRSLLVLDEIGRGTSTYDGLAIARALLEHLVAGERAGPRTLFATHFHELTALAEQQERVVNAHVAVAEGEDGEGGSGLRFLYRIVPGGADRSYGIHVAEMAGLPSPLLARARVLLAELERGPVASDGAADGGSTAPTLQPSLLGVLDREPSPLLTELAGLDIDNLTPLDAIRALFALRERARRECEGAEDAP
jgi:DNA mismatch repair protein MutS